MKAPPPDGLVIRPLCAGDLEQFGEDRGRALVAEWLAQQERGELYVAVAELDGVVIGRRCLDFTNFGDQGIGFGFAATVARSGAHAASLR